MSVFWSAAKSVIGTVAPTLATALLGPLGGQAARIICTVLGLAPDSKPEIIATAVQNATPDQRLALEAADKAFQTRLVEIVAAGDAGQIELNKAEGTRTGWFIAAWRPALAWVCVIGVAWEYVIGPVVFSVIRVRWPAADMLHLDSTGLMGLLFPLLGLGAYRTIEKINNVAGGEIQSTPRERARAETGPSRVTLEPIAVPVPVSRPDVGSDTPPEPFRPDPAQGHIVLVPPIPQPSLPKRPSRFKVVHVFSHAQEGGWSDHPADNGGATMKGVTLANYRVWRNDPTITKEQLRAITDKEAEQFYHAEYWNKARCDAMPPGVDVSVYDMAINAGVGTSIRLLQRVLGVEDDGVVGPITLGALAQQEPAQVIEGLFAAHRDYYRSLDDFSVFGKGWLNRNVERRIVALREVVTSSATAA